MRDLTSATVSARTNSEFQAARDPALARRAASRWALNPPLAACAAEQASRLRMPLHALSKVPRCLCSHAGPWRCSPPAEASAGGPLV